MLVPELNTERLHLRAHRPEDLNDLAAMWAAPEVVRFIGGVSLRREDVWSRLLRAVGHWQVLGFGYWVVCSREGQLLGEIGFADFHRDLEPSLVGVPEMGWALAPHAHGRGLGTEAVQAALRWSESHFSSKRIVCLIDTANTPSIHLAQKVGFREWCRTTYHGVPSVLFER